MVYFDKRASAIARYRCLGDSGTGFCYVSEESGKYGAFDSNVWRVALEMNGSLELTMLRVGQDVDRG